MQGIPGAIIAETEIEVRGLINRLNEPLNQLGLKVYNTSFCSFMK